MRVVRLSATFAVLLLFASCAAERAGPPRTQSKPRDPSIDGKDYLLSESDFRALLVVARRRLKQYPYQPAIYNVHVISPIQVRVHFRDEDGTMGGRWLLLERINGEWHVTQEQSLAEREILM